MIAHISHPSFVHSSYHLEASNALYLEQLQVDTTSAPPMAMKIAEAYAAVQGQLGGGLGAPFVP